jgi:uncharacterized protein (DUF433 family)
MQALSLPLEVDHDGVIRVGGTRLTLDTIITAYQLGDTPEVIAESFPPLELSDVYATIAYYLRHRQELDAYLERRRREAQQIREEMEKRFPPDGFRERLLARRHPQK